AMPTTASTTMRIMAKMSAEPRSCRVWPRFIACPLEDERVLRVQVQDGHRGRAEEAAVPPERHGGEVVPVLDGGAAGRHGRIAGPGRRLGDVLAERTDRETDPDAA